MQRTFLLPLAALLLALPGLRAANAISTAPEDQLTYHTDARFGRVLFIRNEAAQPTASDAFWRAPLPPSPSGPIPNTADLAQPEWAGAVATARVFLRRHASDFLGVAASRQSAANLATNDQRRSTETPLRFAAALANSFDPDPDLAAVSAQRDELGMTHVRFQQTHRGLPVFGTELIVHLTPVHQVSSAGGGLVPGLQVPVDPLLTVEAATQMARHLWQAEFQLPVDPEVRGTRLCVIAPGMLRNDGDPTAYLVWEIKLVNGCTECVSQRFPEDYYLDARTGALRFQHTGVHRLYRKVYDCTTYPYRNLCSSSWVNPATGYHHGRREGETSWGMNPVYNAYDVDALYDHLGNLHGYVATKFGRDGVNGRGGLGNGTASGDPWTTTGGYVYMDQYPPWLPSCPTAGFDWTKGTVAFCLNTLVPDVIAHEYMHGLPFYSHFDGSGNAVGMVYSGESGALDESQADVWGDMYERFLTGSNDWLFGTGWPLGAFRNLALPASSHYSGDPPLPDRFSSAYTYCGSSDHSGVHWNSTIVSKAAYLMAEGGLHNGCTVHPIGTAKLEQILYRAVTQYYSTAATFNEAYADLIQAATDLYGAGSDEVRQTTRALQAVELDQRGYCSGLPPHPPAALDPVGW